MFELTVQTVFSAAHAIVIRGEREPIHGHDWHVTATLRGASLDSDGLLVDFHEVERALGEIVRPFRNANLNDVPPFTHLNPTAENVAKHLADALQAGLVRSHSGGVAGARVASVRVTEAPGCAVTYFLDE